VLHFDKQIKIKSVLGQRTFYQCLYINTTDGFIRYLKPKQGAATTNITPTEAGFSFGVVGLKGNVYTYETSKGNNDVLEYWVGTGNTQTNPYQQASTSTTTVAMLHRRADVKYYCGGKIKAFAYKYDQGDAVRYMFGQTYPPDLQTSSNKYIGNLGIGYQYTDKGLFIIMELSTRVYTCEITDIQDVDVTFDPRPFRVKEDKFQQEGRNDLVKETEHLSNEQASIQNSHECVAEKMASLDFRNQLLQKKQEALNKIKNGGNTYQDRQAQTAYLTLMDPLLSVQLGILDTKTAICGVNADMGKHPDDPNLGSKRACLNDKLAKLIEAEQDMEAIDRQYADQPAKAQAEKGRIALRVQNSNCN